MTSHAYGTFLILPFLHISINDTHRRIPGPLCTSDTKCFPCWSMLCTGNGQNHSGTSMSQGQRPSLGSMGRVLCWSPSWPLPPNHWHPASFSQGFCNTTMIWMTCTQQEPYQSSQSGGLPTHCWWDNFLFGGQQSMLRSIRKNNQVTFCPLTSILEGRSTTGTS